MEIRDLLEAFSDYYKAKIAHEKAVSEYEYEAGYYCYSERRLMDIEADRAEKLLNQFIDARISERIPL